MGNNRKVANILHKSVSFLIQKSLNLTGGLYPKSVEIARKEKGSAVSNSNNI